MRIRLYHNKIVDDGGIPKHFKDAEQGIDIPDSLMIQYENMRAQYIAIRDNLIAVYKEAGGVY